MQIHLRPLHSGQKRVTKPINEIFNIQTNIKFLEAYEYIVMNYQVILIHFEHLEIGAFFQNYLQNQDSMAKIDLQTKAKTI